jgi:hypothetical protein
VGFWIFISTRFVSENMLINHKNNVVIKRSVKVSNMVCVYIHDPLKNFMSSHREWKIIWRRWRYGEKSFFLKNKNIEIQFLKII